MHQHHTYFHHLLIQTQTAPYQPVALKLKVMAGTSLFTAMYATQIPHSSTISPQNQAPLAPEPGQYPYQYPPSYNYKLFLLV